MSTATRLRAYIRAGTRQPVGGLNLPMQPVLLPGVTAANMTDRVAALALRERPFLWWWIAFVPSVLALGLGMISAGWLFYRGVGVWGNDWPVMWGFPIINYVWWIAVASGGTFVSALFFLTRSDWRTATNRIAESMMLFGAAAAGVYPILHLGRPWFAYWLFVYPNTMGLWPQFRSPLFWDFIALFAYVVCSVLFWYLGLLPDLASVRDRATRRVQQMVYGALALGFRGTRREWRHYKATYATLAAIMAPLVVSVHSFVGNDFSGGQTTGWHSTQYPPFFVFGALHSGIAVVVCLIIPLRRLCRLEPYITSRHVEVMGRLMIATTFAMGYSYLMEAFNAFYAPDRSEARLFLAEVTGPYAYVFWGRVALNVIVTQLLWFRAVRLNQLAMLIICLGIIVGMWLERYDIVVVSLTHTKLPSAWGAYHATVWDWGLFAGTIGLFFSGILLSVRFVPILAMAEMRELIQERR